MKDFYTSSKNVLNFNRLTKHLWAFCGLFMFFLNPGTTSAEGWYYVDCWNDDHDVQVVWYLVNSNNDTISTGDRNSNQGIYLTDDCYTTTMYLLSAPDGSNGWTGWAMYTDVGPNIGPIYVYRYGQYSSLNFSVGNGACGVDCPKIGGDFNDPCEDGFANTINGIANASCECLGEVINDDCSGALPLECGQSVSGSTLNATTSILSSTCGPYTYTNPFDVWYSFEADGCSDYSVTVSSTTPGWDGILYVYSGDCGNLVEGSCADDAPQPYDGLEKINLVDLTAGTYYVRTFSYNGESSFSIELQCSHPGNIAYVKANATGANDGSSWTDAFTNLQDALTLNCSNITEIWVAKGTYQPAVNGSFVMKNNIAIYGGFDDTGDPVMADRDWETYPTILQGNGNSVIRNIFTTANPLLASAVLDGFTITNGTADGGIYNTYASPTLSNLIISENSAVGFGGGMANYYSSSPALTNVTLSGNTAAYDGGGMYNNFSFPSLTNVTLSGNTANRNGGGMFNYGSSPILTNVVVSGNKAAGYGGGLTNYSSSPTLTNVTINENKANDGGGMVNDDSSPTLTNVTISGNTASNGGEWYNLSGTSIIRNSIIYGNGIVGTLYDNQNSLIQGHHSTANGNIDYTGNVTDLFINPATGDYSLLATSPAINTGDNSHYPGLYANTKDLAGNPRVYNYANSGVIDMGTYEFQGEPVIPITPDGNNILYVDINVIGGEANGSSWENAVTELADALKYAKVNEANWTTTPLQIWTAKGTYKPLYSPEDSTNFGTDQGRDNTFSMVNNVQLYGGFAGGEATLADRNLSITTNATILSGDIGTINDIIDNTYHVVVSAGEVGTGSINGFTIRDGNANGAGNVTINGFIVSGGAGGGVHNASSSPAISNVTIVGNFANDAGGMYNNNASPVLTNLVISDNQTPGYGGGMYNFSSSPILINATFGGNSAGAIGGGILNYSSSPSLANSIVWGNTASSGKGIANISNSSPSISYSLVEEFNDIGNNNIDGTNIGNGPQVTNPANGDYSLIGTSPAINTGSNNLYPGIDADTKDLAGNPRVFNYADNGIIDMGAYEYQGERVTIIPNTANILYVDKSVDINDPAYTATGDSWANALTELADALKYAKEHEAIWTSGSIDSLQIFVAKGAYKPLYSAEEGINFGTDQVRDNTFLMVNNVQLYGGFAGGEATLADRNLSITTNATILSGDIGIENDNADNTYHVVVSAGEVGTGLINGFTIKDGNANGAGSITINGSIVSGGAGGGVHNALSSPAISNVAIFGNYANDAGGMYNNTSSPVLSNLVINNNQTPGYGGGMYNFSSSPILVNSTFGGNSAGATGGGILNYSSSPIVTNSIIWGNTASSGKGIANISSSSTSISYSLVEDFNDTGNNNIDGTNAGNAPQFANPANGNYSLLSTSPAINAGSNASYIAAGGDLPNDVDLVGNPRLFQTTIDMGAYEIQISPLNGSVTWNSACGARNATVKLYIPSTAIEVESYNVSIQSGGSFNIPAVKIGTYDVIVQVKGYLAKGTRNVVIVADDNTLSVGSIINGNINNDGAVNINDFSSFAPAFSSVNGSANYNPLADLNCDGGVNINDFSIFVNGFSQVGDSAPLSALPAQ